MKKILALILTLILTLSLVACSDNKIDTPASQSAAESKIESASVSEAESKAESEAETGDAVAADNYVLVDNELMKIVVVDAGVFQYNPEWVGYNLQLTNKTDRYLHFTTFAEASEKDEQGNSNRDTCYLGGQKTEANLGFVLNPNTTDVPAFLTIKGLTDPAEVKDVSGTIRVKYNDEEAVIDYYPYHFK